MSGDENNVPQVPPPLGQLSPKRPFKSASQEGWEVFKLIGRIAMSSQSRQAEQGISESGFPARHWYSGLKLCSTLVFDALEDDFDTALIIAKRDNGIMDRQHNI